MQLVRIAKKNVKHLTRYRILQVFFNVTLTVTKLYILKNLYI